jgi:glycosyltransferase involved in cell wall biosynthesis
MLTPSRITAAGIMNDKNLRQLPWVVAALKARGGDWHGVIVGDDRSKGRVESRRLYALAAALGVGDRFTILPRTTAIEDYYPHADVVVTLAPREPFGRTPVEAVACGVPVVGSNTGGVYETLGQFAPQWTVDPADADGVARTILRVVEDPSTPRLLAAGQRWVEQHCSPRAYASGLLALTGLAASGQKTGAFL